MTKEIDKTIVITGLVCITVIECVALFLGYNGTLQKIVMATIAAAIGITIPNPIQIKNKRKW